MNTTTVKPKTIDKYLEYGGVEYASFSYYDGIHYAESKGLHHTTSFDKLYNGTHYIVCCGEVIIRVDETLFIDIERATHL